MGQTKAFLCSNFLQSRAFQSSVLAILAISDFLSRVFLVLALSVARVFSSLRLNLHLF